MAYTYIEVCNETLRRLNEVEMTSSQFSGAKGIQALVKDAINNAQRDIYSEIESGLLRMPQQVKH